MDTPHTTDPLTADARAPADVGGVGATRADRSLVDLVKDLRDESTLLIRQEVALAKTELGEKASRFGTDLGAIATGGAVALVGALALVTALAYFLAWVLDFFMDYSLALWIAWGLLGLILAGVGYAMLQKGLSDLKRQSPVPEKTVQSLKEDQQWLASKTH